MADAPRIEPMSREEREEMAAHDRVWPWCEQLDRYEATVQAAEERAEALRAVVDRLASWDMLSTVRTSELVADGPYMRRMILAALANDDAARKAAS